MITSTHLNISIILYNHLVRKLNFKLHLLSFMLGSIKPDYHDTEIKLPHYLDDSLDEIIEYSSRLRHEVLEIRTFSFRLGVICHFMCDYFCLYHGKTLKKRNCLEHYMYEFMLHFKLLTLLASGSLQIENNWSRVQGDILCAIHAFNKEYIKEASSLDKDIKYALSAALMVSEHIITGNTAVLSYFQNKPFTEMIKLHKKSTEPYL